MPDYASTSRHREDDVDVVKRDADVHLRAAYLLRPTQWKIGRSEPEGPSVVNFTRCDSFEYVPSNSNRANSQILCRFAGIEFSNPSRIDDDNSS